jgi:hypothetical protein
MKNDENVRLKTPADLECADMSAPRRVATCRAEKSGDRLPQSKAG